MKAALIYWTGTYNTRFLVNKVKEELIKINYEVALFEIDVDSKNIDLKDYDLIGISYPIYAFNVPRFFMKYLKRLKFYSDKKYIIFKQSGEPLALNNASSRKIIRIFKKNKIKDYSEYHFILPYNIHFKFDDILVETLLISNEKLLKIMMYDLKNDLNSKIKSSIFYTINAFFLSIQGIGGNINSFLYKVDENKCINCKKCINICPMHNIYTKNEKIKFHHNCAMCMRCSFYCPKDAINIGFINSWRVNGAYKLEELDQNKANLKENILDSDNKFYKIYTKYLENVDEKYKKYFKN